MTLPAPAVPHEMLDLGVEMRARYDFEARIGGARLLDDLPGLEGVWDRNKQHSRIA